MTIEIIILSIFVSALIVENHWQGRKIKALGEIVTIQQKSIKDILHAIDGVLILADLLNDRISEIQDGKK